MSLVGDTVTIKIRNGQNELQISGEILEKYTDTKESFEEVLDNANNPKTVKTKFPVDYYMIKLTNNTIKHVLCSDVLEIVP